MGKVVISSILDLAAEYKLKYWYEHTSLNSDIYRLEILEAGYSGNPIEVHGNAYHEYAERKDLIHPIIASSLKISLEADSNLNLQDLYTEQERHYEVKYYRNGQIIFHGYLKPDGIWEDWVNDRWELSIDAMDGLSMLKELAFVRSDGTFFENRLTHFQIIFNCLRRIGYSAPINISASIPVYDGYTGTESILNAVTSSTERYYQDASKNKPMDCESVLKSILQIYGASIVQMNGEWWIFRAIDVSDVMAFKRYVGVSFDSDISWNALQNIGSQIDGYSIHHASANQKKSIDASTQAFRVNYKYGFGKSLFLNPDLESDSASNIEGWSYSSAAIVEPNDYGVKVNAVDSSSSGIFLESDQTNIFKQGDVLKVTLDLYSGGNLQGVYVTIKNENYYHNQGEWVTTGGSDVLYLQKNADNNIEITLPPLEVDGNVSIEIEFPKHYGSVSNGEYLVVNSIDVTPLTSDNKKGEFHTVQRTTRISTVTKDDVSVYNGDTQSEIYYGTIYKPDNNPTSSWNRNRTEDSTPSLIQLMAEDMLRISPRPMIVFEGDIYGYIPYLSKVNINNVAGKFQVAKYSHDAEMNINRLVLKEYEDAYLVRDTDFIYELDYDLGNETRVLIKS